MDAIVLAAGKSTRMWPLCSGTPKPLIEVAGRSLLHRMLDGLATAGCATAWVVVGHEKKAVAAHARSWKGPTKMRVKTVDQGTPRGTGHAVAQVARRLKADALVVMADGLLDSEVLARLRGGKGFLVAAARVPDPERYGALRVAGRMVRAIVEKAAKPPSDLVNAGYYRVPLAALRECTNLRPSRRGELEFTDVLQAWAKRGEVQWIKATGWMDIGRPWDLLPAEAAAIKAGLDARLGRKTAGGPGTIEAGVQVRGRLFVSEGAVVKSGVYVEGDVLIGPGARVGPNAYLRGPLTIGPGCHVGNGCEIKASYLFARSNVPHLSYVGDSVVGEGANLGAGTQVANLRHDGASVRVHHLGAIHDTGRVKFGAIIGDGAKTGVNASINPGTILGVGARVAAGRAVKGTVADGVLVR